MQTKVYLFADSLVYFNRRHFVYFKKVINVKRNVMKKTFIIQNCENIKKWMHIIFPLKCFLT
jgi:hypothetical protein